MMVEGTTVDGYIRVSRVGTRDTERESYQTERRQREAIERWAEYKHVTIAKWHVDRDDRATPRPAALGRRATPRGLAPGA